MADLYVSMSGSDSNKGSLSKPFATIQAAADNAKPGDTVHVLAGTYAGGIASRVNKVTYQAEGKVYIIGGTTASDGDVWSQYGNNVTIKGFNISGLQSPNAFDLLAEYGSYETVKDCVLHDLQTTGLLDYGGAFVADSYYGGHDGIISGCRVYNVGPPGTTSNLVQGIYIGTRNWTVTNDLAYNIVGTGITSWHDATNLTITYDTVDNCYQGITIGAGEGYQSNNPVNNNSIVANCIVSNSAYGIDEEGSTGHNNKYIGNVVWKNANFDFNLQDGSKAVGTLCVNPQYKDPKAGDYSLKRGSKAAGKGSSISGPTPPAPTAAATAPTPGGPTMSAGIANVHPIRTSPPGAAALESTTTPRTIDISDGATATVRNGTVNIDGSATVNVNGDATINAGTGIDTIRVTAGNVVVNGSTGTISFLGAGAGTTTLNLKGGNTAASFGGGGATVNVGGNGTFTCGAGTDLYNFTKDASIDTAIINNFAVGTDHLHLIGYGSGATDGVTSITDGPAGVSIALVDGSSISLNGVHTATTGQLLA